MAYDGAQHVRQKEIIEREVHQETHQPWNTAEVAKKLKKSLTRLNKSEWNEKRSRYEPAEKVFYILKTWSTVVIKGKSISTDDTCRSYKEPVALPRGHLEEIMSSTINTRNITAFVFHINLD
ncbi:uncharacterized protein LOC135163632 [Diachasmimorpha longicaudata]|uniref:uncharacterized protein LOC135163632 n=1 Tax=Diachasmimorpha longicaudata TaxID=58733 RepID=UPI0030B91863